jgi:hypothetical protein
MRTGRASGLTAPCAIREASGGEQVHDGAWRLVAMIEDDREGRLRPDAPVFEVAPVKRRRAVPVLAVVGVVVAVTAFVAGMAAASSGPDTRVREAVPSFAVSPPGSTLGPNGAAADPTPDPTPAPVRPSAAAVAERPGSPTPPPGSSDFASDFDPADLLADVEGGASCAVSSPLDKEAPRTRADGPRLTFQRSWLIDCPIAAAERQGFLVRLFRALATRVPAETFSYGTTLDGSGSALFPYAEQPMAGTVAVHAGGVGRRLAVVVTIEEWQTG